MKAIFAAMSLVCALTFALGDSGTPVSAAPLSAAAAPTPPQFGACRWYCGSRSFTTAAACAASCSFECDQIC
jgi:hypothetical protein